MAGVVKNIFSIKELRDRIFFTLGLLIIFRIGAQIPCPGIDAVALSAFYKTAGSEFQTGIIALLDLFSGGALSMFAIFALGIMPYISSSIIMQLLQAVVPAISKLSKEGAYGRRKIQQYTRYGTVLLCIVQGIGLLFLLQNVATQAANAPDGPYQVVFGGMDAFSSPFFYASFVAILTCGTMVLLWLGEQITERGIGNGASLIIFAGIAARIPSSIVQIATATDALTAIDYLIMVVIFILIIGVVAAEQQSTRRVPVQYAKRIVGNQIYGGQSQYIPFKMNPAGVIPIIFASSVIMLPSQLLGTFGTNIEVVRDIANYLSPGHAPYMILYFLLVMFFAFFYTQIYFNPQEIAENMKRNNGFIPGIRPGANTAEFLHKVLNRITFPGSIFLGFIAIFPDIVMRAFGLPNQYTFLTLMGGTSLLIIVGVALDTVKQIESHLLTRNYSGFFKKSRIRGRR